MANSQWSRVDPFWDAYVVAPDESRAGLVWAVGNFAMHEICPPTPERWGVYGLAFPRPVRCVEDLVEFLRAALPELRRIQGIRGKDIGA